MFSVHRTVAQRSNEPGITTQHSTAHHSTKSEIPPNPLPSASVPHSSLRSSNSSYHIASRCPQFHSSFVQHCSAIQFAIPFCKWCSKQKPWSPVARRAQSLIGVKKKSSQDHIDTDAHSFSTYVDNSKSSDLFQRTVTTYTCEQALLPAPDPNTRYLIPICHQSRYNNHATSFASTHSSNTQTPTTQQ